MGDTGDGVDGRAAGETEGMAGLRDNRRETAEVGKGFMVGTVILGGGGKGI